MLPKSYTPNIAQLRTLIYDMFSKKVRVKMNKTDHK